MDEKRIRKKYDYGQVLTMMVEVAGDLMRTMVEEATSPREIAERKRGWLERLEELRLFVNESFRDAARVYDAVPPVVDATWNISRI